MRKLFGDDWPLILILIGAAFTCVFIVGWVMPKMFFTIWGAAT